MRDLPGKYQISKNIFFSFYPAFFTSSINKIAQLTLICLFYFYKKQIYSNLFCFQYIGPGHYQVDRDLTNTMSAKRGGPLESGTYLVNDNGHVN